MYQQRFILFRCCQERHLIYVVCNSGGAEDVFNDKTIGNETQNVSHQFFLHDVFFHKEDIIIHQKSRLCFVIPPVGVNLQNAPADAGLIAMYTYFIYSFIVVFFSSVLYITPAKHL